ncbi:MAG TPA: hypothetical protein VHE79_01855 [Spirochaetia bacterium]
MSSGAKMFLFFLCATVFNLLLMAIFIVAFVALILVIPGVAQNQTATMALGFVGFLAAIVLTFLVYGWVMKKVTVKLELEKHIPQLFKNRKR